MSFFESKGRGRTVLFGIGEVDELKGVPPGATVRLRLRPDEFPVAFVQTETSITKHALEKDANGDICIGEKLAENATRHPPISQAAIDVLAERRRQIEVEGWTAEHDDQHKTGELAAAAACYALWASAPSAENTYWNRAREEAAEFLWPWDLDWWKPSTPRRDLVKAAALAIAAIERLDRANMRKGDTRHE